MVFLVFLLLSWWRCVELVAALLLSLLLSCCSCLAVDTLACMRYAGSACDYPVGLALWMRRGPSADTPPAHPESQRKGRGAFSDKLDRAPNLARFAAPRELRTHETWRVMVFTPAIRGDAGIRGVWRTLNPRTLASIGHHPDTWGVGCLQTKGAHT